MSSTPSIRLRNVIKNRWREDMIEKDVCRREAWYFAPPCPPYTFWCRIILKRIGMASKETRDGSEIFERKCWLVFAWCKCVFCHGVVYD